MGLFSKLKKLANPLAAHKATNKVISKVASKDPITRKVLGSKAGKLAAMGSPDIKEIRKGAVRRNPVVKTTPTLRSAGSSSNPGVAGYERGTPLKSPKARLAQSAMNRKGRNNLV